MPDPAVAVPNPMAVVPNPMSVGAPNAADDAFLAALDSANIAMTNPGDAVALGQQVCPMLSQPGQNAADAASKIADTAGMPLGPATMFTGFAISAFCPGALASFGNLPSQLPMNLLGGF